MMQSVLPGFGRSSFAHDLFGKSASAFPDHVPKAALFSLIRPAAAIAKNAEIKSCPATQLR
jgi:hypothetical protein